MQVNFEKERPDRIFGFTALPAWRDSNHGLTGNVILVVSSGQAEQEGKKNGGDHHHCHWPQSWAFATIFATMWQSVSIKKLLFVAFSLYIHIVETEGLKLFFHTFLQARTSCRVVIVIVTRTKLSRAQLCSWLSEIFFLYSTVLNSKAKYLGAMKKSSEFCQYKSIIFFWFQGRTSRWIG